MVPPLLNILRLVLGPALVFSFIMHTFPITAVINEDISCIAAVYQRLHCTQTTTCSALFTQTHVPTRRVCILRLSTAVTTPGTAVCSNRCSDISLASQLHCQRLHDHVYYTKSCGEFTAKSHRIRTIESQRMRASRIFIANSKLHERL